MGEGSGGNLCCAAEESLVGAAVMFVGGVYRVVTREMVEAIVPLRGGWEGLEV